MYYSGGNVGINNANPQNNLDVSGVIRATGTNLGSITIRSGGTGNNCGFVEFWTTGGTRKGYMGWIGTDANYLMIQAENGCSGYELNGNLKINNKKTRLLNKMKLIKEKMILTK